MAGKKRGLAEMKKGEKNEDSLETQNPTKRPRLSDGSNERDLLRPVDKSPPKSGGSSSNASSSGSSGSSGSESKTQRTAPTGPSVNNSNSKVSSSSSSSGRSSGTSTTTTIPIPPSIPILVSTMISTTKNETTVTKQPNTTSILETNRTQTITILPPRSDSDTNKTSTSPLKPQPKPEPQPQPQPQPQQSQQSSQQPQSQLQPSKKPSSLIDIESNKKPSMWWIFAVAILVVIVAVAMQMRTSILFESMEMRVDNQTSIFKHWWTADKRADLIERTINKCLLRRLYLWKDGQQDGPNYLIPREEVEDILYKQLHLSKEKWDKGVNRFQHRIDEGKLLNLTLNGFGLLGPEEHAALKPQAINIHTMHVC